MFDIFFHIYIATGVLAQGNVHPRNLDVSAQEIAEHQNILMHMIYSSLPRRRRVRVYRFSPFHFISERILYHLIEQHVDKERIKIRRYKGRHFKIISIKSIAELKMICNEERDEFMIRRYGVNARSYLVDESNSLAPENTHDGNGDEG